MPRSVRALIFCVLLLTGPTPGPVGAAPDSEPATVLVLHSYSSITPYTARQMDGIRAAVVGRVGPRTQFIEESLNILGTISDDQQRLIRDLLRLRYARARIDVVITTDTPALRFMASHGREVFPDTPIVFCAAFEVPDVARAPGSGITGVTERTDAPGTLELIRSLHPGVRRVLTIGTAGSHSRRLEQSVIDAAAAFEPPLEIETLRDENDESLHARVRRLHDDEAILYLSLYTIDGRVNRVDDRLPVLSAAASRPMYALFDVYIGHGPIGGRIADGRSYGEQAGEIAARILEGAPTSDLPIIEGGSRPVFDARQLKRWGIAPHALPAGSVVLFAEQTFWQANRSALLTSGAVALVLVPALGAFVFLWVRASRSARVLRDTRDHQSDIAASLGVGLVVQDDTGRITEANRLAERILGLTREQILGRDSLDPRWRTVNADGSTMAGTDHPSMIALRTGRPQVDRVVGVHRPNGTLAWLSVNSVPLMGADGPTPKFTVTTFADVTSEHSAVEWQSGVNDVLRRLALDEPIGRVLETLCLAVERRAPGMVCTILLLDADGRHLRHGAAPNLPPDLWQPIDGLETGPSVGSCGTAVYRKQRVIVEDISTSPLWEGHAEPLIRHGLRACWSEPVRAPDGAVLGTLALYYTAPRGPSDAEIALIESAAMIAGVVISKHRREQQIRESDERFRALSDNVPGVLYSYVVTPELRRHSVFMSPYLERLLGPRTGAAVRADMNRYFDLIHPEDAERVQRLAAESRASCTPIEIEYRLRTDSGEYRWVRGVSAPVLLEDGSIRAHGILLDITETRHAERARKEAEERLSTLSRHVPGALFTYVTTPDNDRHSCLLSPYFDSLIGPNAAARVRNRVNDIFDMIHPDDLGHVRHRGAHCRANCLPFECEYRLRTDAGEWRWVRGVSTPEPLATGEIRWHGLLLDIDDAKRGEEALRASEARLRSLTDNIPGAVYRSIMHRDGSRTLLFASREYESVMGRAPVLGHEPFAARDTRYHGEDIPRMRDEFRDAGGRLRAVDIDARVVHPSGEARWVKIRSSPTPLPDGDVLWDGVILDIHSQKCAQDEVQRLAHTRAMLLEELDHRVKNSLAGLLTLIDLSAQSGASSDQVAEAIRARVHAMAAAHSLLSRSRWQPISLDDLIRALVPAGLGDRVRSRGLPVLVPARHATAVGMVVQELLTNALKHGALSNAIGAVEISWDQEPVPEDRLAITLGWNESGGPPIENAPNPGMGSSLVEGLLGFQLGGVAELRFPREGAHHSLRFTIEAHARPAERSDGAHANGAARTATPIAS